MIQQPKNWESVQSSDDQKRLPLGAYVCQIRKAVITQTAAGYGILQLGFDITEGEYKDFYRQKFATDPAPDKRWKGVLHIFLPCEDGSPSDEGNKRAFKDMVLAFEQSNPGYRCFQRGAFDEQTLVGKTVGVLYRNVEWSYAGKSGWSPRPNRCISADRVRSGDYYLPKDKPLKKPASSAPSAPSAQNDAYTEVEDNDLPF